MQLFWPPTFSQADTQPTPRDAITVSTLHGLFINSEGVHQIHLRVLRQANFVAMCRIEERFYIGTDGSRKTFEETFLCDKARGGSLCSTVKRRKYAYNYPKVSSRAESPDPLDPPTPTEDEWRPTNLKEPKVPPSTSAKHDKTKQKPRKPTTTIELGTTRRNTDTKSSTTSTQSNTAQKRGPRPVIVHTGPSYHTTDSETSSSRGAYSIYSRASARSSSSSKASSSGANPIWSDDENVNSSASEVSDSEYYRRRARPPARRAQESSYASGSRPMMPPPPSMPRRRRPSITRPNVPTLYEDEREDRIRIRPPLDRRHSTSRRRSPDPPRLVVWSKDSRRRDMAYHGSYMNNAGQDYPHSDRTRRQQYDDYPNPSAAPPPRNLSHDNNPFLPCPSPPLPHNDLDLLETADAIEVLRADGAQRKPTLRRSAQSTRNSRYGLEYDEWSMSVARTTPPTTRKPTEKKYTTSRKRDKPVVNQPESQPAMQQIFRETNPYAAYVENYETSSSEGSDPDPNPLTSPAQRPLQRKRSTIEERGDAASNRSEPQRAEQQVTQATNRYVAYVEDYKSSDADVDSVQIPDTTETSGAIDLRSDSGYASAPVSAYTNAKLPVEPTVATARDIELSALSVPDQMSERAIAREKLRQEKAQEQREEDKHREKLRDEEVAAGKVRRKEQSKRPPRDPTKRRMVRRNSMTQDQIGEQRRLLIAEGLLMQKERDAAEAREREERDQTSVAAGLTTGPKQTSTSPSNFDLFRTYPHSIDDPWESTSLYEYVEDSSALESGFSALRSGDDAASAAEVKPKEDKSAGLSNLTSTELKLKKEKMIGKFFSSRDPMADEILSAASEFVEVLKKPEPEPSVPAEHSRRKEDHVRPRDYTAPVSAPFGKALDYLDLAVETTTAEGHSVKENAWENSALMRPSKRPLGARRDSMPHAEMYEGRRLLVSEVLTLQIERRSLEALIRGEETRTFTALAPDRKPQNQDTDPSYYDPRGGDRARSKATSSLVRRNSVSRRNYLDRVYAMRRNTPPEVSASTEVSVPTPTRSDLDTRAGRKLEAVKSTEQSEHQKEVDHRKRGGSLLELLEQVNIVLPPSLPPTSPQRMDTTVETLDDQSKLQALQDFEVRNPDAESFEISNEIALRIMSAGIPLNAPQDHVLDSPTEDTCYKSNATVRKDRMPPDLTYGPKDWPRLRSEIETFGLDFLHGDLMPVHFRMGLLFLVDIVCLMTDDMLIWMKLLEPALVESQVRLRWKCKCGMSLYSDVKELREGGIEDLVTRMRQTSGAKVHVTEYSQDSSNQRYDLSRPVIWLQDSATQLWSTLQDSVRRAPGLPRYSRSSNTTTTSTAPAGTTVGQKVEYMLACLHRDRMRKHLRQDPMENVTTDRTLLEFMRRQYSQRRNRFIRTLSLRTIKDISFARFRLPHGGLVDVRHHIPYCETACQCLPPEPKVEPSPTAEYRCTPIPPLVSPPLPPEYLLSLFTCPADAGDESTWILDQLPKRTCGKLEGGIKQPAEGWGLYYAEGWDVEKITFVVFVIFMLASLLFGILWSRFHFDIQGAFGVSAYLVTACGVVITMIVMRTT